VPILLLSSSALMLGMVHGLGLDHLMAIAALSIDGREGEPRQLRIVRTAMQFAFGHMLVLGLGVVAALAVGWTAPAAVTAGAERLGSLLLIALGGAGLWTLAAGRAYGHVHAEDDGRRRWHFHLGTKGAHAGAHSHSNLATVMGAVFAISSLRALVLLAPMGTSLRTLALPVVLLLIALFGLGILVSMSLFGVVLARVWSLRAVEALGRTAGLLVASASVGLGIYWMIG
jgi:hypothetical protein